MVLNFKGKVLSSRLHLRRRHRGRSPLSKPLTPEGTPTVTRRRRFAVSEPTAERERYIERLFIAICSGDTEEMEKLLHSRPSTYNDTSTDLVNCACGTGKADSVEILLKNGIPFRGTGGKGDAPLHTAIRRNSLELVRILTNYGGDVNIQTSFERRSPLHLAASARKLAILRFLLEKDADVHRVDIYGSTPLHLASEAGFSNGVGTLLEFHADPNVFNKDGWTALHLAAANGHLSVVEQLIQANATVDSQNQFGRTPLHWACAAGHAEVVRVLLKHGSSVEVKDKHGKVAFDHASSKIIRNLIDETSSVVSFSVIPRIGSCMSYVVRDSDLRQVRVSAFTDALARARSSSSNFSSDSGIEGSPQEDDVFDYSTFHDTQRSSLSNSSVDGNTRHRRTAMCCRPEGLRQWEIPPKESIEINHENFHQKLGHLDHWQTHLNARQVRAPCTTSASGSGSSLSVSDEDTSDWTDWEVSHQCVPKPSSLAMARHLERLLSTIREDDKLSSGTSNLEEEEPDQKELLLDQGSTQTRKDMVMVEELGLQSNVREESRESSTSIKDLKEHSDEEDSECAEHHQPIDSAEESEFLGEPIMLRKKGSNTSEGSDTDRLSRDLHSLFDRMCLNSETETVFEKVAKGVRTSISACSDAIDAGISQLRLSR